MATLALLPGCVNKAAVGAPGTQEKAQATVVQKGVDNKAYITPTLTLNEPAGLQLFPEYQGIQKKGRHALWTAVPWLDRSVTW